ncbi:uncharacterized protein EV154DRAFT_431299 [Mucor mucedo]|uniref:uncharacterized protein n=1 Tax=Mucor mucedo TaxID=29922 RepID=UPI00221F3FA1|nr:uncharacterized protein EV154DRAFT_431299 [Mucor mucedo]KAI7872611.1 hypothetical protein EV154DRAFT_431299 [Mucor mucedo]
MKFSGELFTYDEEKRLTAFETGPIHSTETIVFIGGLNDGFNAVPYLLPLVQKVSSLNWSLVQVQLSSSFGGYGTTNLQRDTEELDSLVTFLRDKRGKSKIVFLGHSTGSQDCYWHNKNGKSSIAGYILQAPVSDREYFNASSPEIHKYLDLSINLRNEGKGNELLPKDAFWNLISADRFFSLCAKGGDDDVFSTDLTVGEIQSLYEGVNKPICWVYSDQDEYYASAQDKHEVMNRFKSICPAIKVTAIVPHGDHSITREDSQEYFCNIVEDFLKTL